MHRASSPVGDAACDSIASGSAKKLEVVGGAGDDSVPNQGELPIPAHGRGDRAGQLAARAHRGEQHVERSPMLCHLQGRGGPREG